MDDNNIQFLIPNKESANDFKQLVDKIASLENAFSDLTMLSPQPARSRQLRLKILSLHNAFHYFLKVFTEEVNSVTEELKS